jgi:hypothetical protein
MARHIARGPKARPTAEFKKQGMLKMIDPLKRIAVAIQWLRLPSLTLGLICLTSLAVMILFFPSDHDARWIIPCMVGFLWGAGTYLFIDTFRSAPDKPSRPLGLLGKMKYAFTRAWYWLISMILIIGTIAAIVTTVRMVSIWMRD